MFEYYEIVKRVLDVKTNKTICVIETFPLITENVPSDKSIFINWENAEEQIQEENLPMRIKEKTKGNWRKNEVAWKRILNKYLYECRTII